MCYVHKEIMIMNGVLSWLLIWHSVLTRRYTIWMDKAGLIFAVYKPHNITVRAHTYISVSLVVYGYSKRREPSELTFVYYTGNQTWNNRTSFHSVEGLDIRFTRNRRTLAILHTGNNYRAWAWWIFLQSKIFLRTTVIFMRLRMVHIIT